MKILKTFCILLIFFLFFQNHSLASSSQQVDKISKNLRCLICQGQSVYDSQSDFALSMKTLIKKKIDEGKNDDEIYVFFSKLSIQLIAFSSFSFLLPFNTTYGRLYLINVLSKILNDSNLSFGLSLRSSLTHGTSM